MIVKSKLTEKDFINLNFLLLWSRPAIKFFSFVMAITFLTVLANLFLKVTAFNNTTWSYLVIPFAVIALTYYNAKKSFSSNEKASEQIEYDFGSRSFSVTGRSFNASYAWDSILKVSKTKGWIIVWQSKQSASPIPLRYFDQLQLDELKEILEQNKVKNNL